jgi:Protein of unknown function (DUF4232)
MRRALVIGAAITMLAAGCGSTKTVTVTSSVTTVKTVTTAPTTAPATTQAAGPAPCSGADLQASFSVIAGSAGAGQIGYELVLTNSSSAACTVSGLPIAALLDKGGAALPTQISSAQVGQPSTIVLQHGDTVKADARFSPDVPGTGEPQTGPCEATSYSLQITATGGGTVKTPISPPTPVCEHGSLNFSAFTPGG